MKKLFIYLKGYARECVLGPLFKLLEASFELIIPLLVASIIDRGILAGDQAYIVKMVAIMALLGLTGLVLVALAYPVYNKILKKEREKIAPEILRLTEELLK